MYFSKPQLGIFFLGVGLIWLLVSLIYGALGIPNTVTNSSGSDASAAIRLPTATPLATATSTDRVMPTSTNKPMPTNTPSPTYTPTLTPTRVIPTATPITIFKKKPSSDDDRQ